MPDSLETPRGRRRAPRRAPLQPTHADCYSRRMRKVLIALLAALAPLVASLTEAHATTFYASPDGAGFACTRVAPCPLTTAVGRALNNDVVIAAPGLYRHAAGSPYPRTDNAILLRGTQPSDNFGEGRTLIIGYDSHTLLMRQSQIRGITVWNLNAGGWAVAAKSIHTSFVWSLYHGACSATEYITNSVCYGERVGLFASVSSGRRTNTFVDASTLRSEGTALSLFSGGTGGNDTYVTNSLILGNARLTTDGAATALLDVSYSGVTGDLTTTGMGARLNAPASTNVFADPDLQVWTPRDGSPVVNAGVPNHSTISIGDTDLAGNARVVDGRIDMGAYENQTAIGGPAPADPAGQLPIDPGTPTPAAPAPAPAGTGATVTAPSLAVTRPRARVTNRAIRIRSRVTITHGGRVTQVIRYRLGRRNRVACRATMVTSAATRRTISCRLTKRTRTLLRQRRVRLTVSTVFRPTGAETIKRTARVSLKRRR